MQALQNIYKSYVDKKPWLGIQSPSAQVRSFERRFKTHSLILDIGCGAGYDTYYLRQHGHHVISADIDSGVADVVCDVVNMPFKDKYFDGVFCRGVLHLCCNPKKAFSELLRVGKNHSVMFVSYSLNVIGLGDEIQLAERPFYYGKAKFLYEHITRKNHQDHAHLFYSGVFRNEVH